MDLVRHLGHAGDSETDERLRGEARKSDGKIQQAWDKAEQ